MVACSQHVPATNTCVITMASTGKAVGASQELTAVYHVTTALPVIRLFPPPTNPEAIYSVEVGREFMLFCTVEDTYPFAIHSVEAYRLGEEPDNLFISKSFVYRWSHLTG